MSKHRHKSNEGNRNGRNQFNGTMNNNPFGISPQQLLGLLGGNIDMNGLGNMLSSMGKEGVDLNTFNQQFGGINKGLGENNIMDNMNQVNKKPKNNSGSDNIHKSKHKISESEDHNDNEDDENIEFLKALKNIVDPNRIEFIDKIINLCNEGMFNDK